MMQPDAKAENVYLHPIPPKKTIDSLATPTERVIMVTLFTYLR